MERRIEFRQLANILSLFLIVQFAGLIVGMMTIPSVQYLSVSGTTSTSPFQALTFVIYIVIATIVLLVVFRIYHGDVLFKLLEAYVVIVASFFIFLIVLGYAFPNAPSTPITIVSFLIAVFLVIAKNKWQRLRNLVAVIASIGVGVVLGINGFFFSYLILLVLAVYDFIAVFITKHMLTLAKEFSSRNLAFLIGSSDVEVLPSRYLSSKDLAEFRKDLSKNKPKDPFISRLIKQGNVPMVSQVQLGTGDLAAPLALTVGIFVSTLSYYLAVMAILGSLGGIAATMMILRKYKVALPAIPPIFSMINLFLAIAFVTYSKPNFQLAGLFFLTSVVLMSAMLIKLRSTYNK